MYAWESKLLPSWSGLHWPNSHLRQILKKQSSIPRVFVFSWFERGFRLNRSCSFLALSLTERRASDIHLTYPLSVREYPRPSSRSWRYFTPVHHENGVSQSWSLSPFVFKFFFEMAMKTTLFSRENNDTDICSDKKPSDAEYGEDIVLLSEYSNNSQVYLCRLVDSVCIFGICFAHGKYKVRDWSGSKANLRARGLMGKVDISICLNNCISPGGTLSEEVPSHIQKTRLVINSLRHLWRRHDIRLLFRGWVYAATVRLVLLYSSQTWPLGA